jgi:hypothetical protein
MDIRGREHRQLLISEHHAGGYSRLVCLYSPPLAAGDGVEFCFCQNAIVLALSIAGHCIFPIQASADHPSLMHHRYGATLAPRL